MSELERILAEQFPSVVGGAASRRRKPAPGLGGAGDDPSNDSTEGHSPGLLYAGGPQTQETGAQGTKAQALLNKTADLFRDIDRSKCPPWLSPECMELLSRGMEQTLRNFQLTARRPSHIDPPFKGLAIDKFDVAGVTLPIGAHGSPGAWTPICSVQNAGIGYRTTIKSIGQAVLDLLAWDWIEWRIVLNGQPLSGLDGFRAQLFDWEPNCCLVPINLVGEEKIALEARNHDPANTWKALGRLGGWRYPVRVETGDSIRSTLVD